MYTKYDSYFYYFSTNILLYTGKAILKPISSSVSFADNKLVNIQEILGEASITQFAKL
jgi:hypothetical protein